MRYLLKWAATVAVAGVLASPAVAQEKLKVGVIVTLSGPAAALGAQVRDGFALAVKDLGGKMGGKDVEVLVADDELKPDGAVAKVTLVEGIVQVRGDGVHPGVDLNNSAALLTLMEQGE